MHSISRATRNWIMYCRKTFIKCVYWFCVLLLSDSKSFSRRGWSTIAKKCTKVQQIFHSCKFQPEFCRFHTTFGIGNTMLHPKLSNKTNRFLEYITEPIFSPYSKICATTRYAARCFVSSAMVPQWFLMSPQWFRNGSAMVPQWFSMSPQWFLNESSSLLIELSSHHHPITTLLPPYYHCTCIARPSTTLHPTIVRLSHVHLAYI